MFNKPILFRPLRAVGSHRIGILLLLLGLVLICISERGCPKRGKNRSGSSNDTFTIKAPTLLTAIAVSPYEIDLNWIDNSNNEDGFRIERKMWSSGGWSQITTVGADITSYFDIGPLSPGTTYYYRVYAFNSMGDISPYSNEADATTIALIWAEVSAGGFHTIARADQGTLWSCGRNFYGQLGVGDYIDRLILTQVYGSETDWSAISAGGWHTLALKNDGTLWAWGWDYYGQCGWDTALGDGNIPFPVGTDSDWSVIGAGDDHSLAIKTDGSIWAWGCNDFGQVGLGYTTPDTTGIITATRIGTNVGWVAVTAGAAHSVGLRTDGSIWAWGDNQYGQIGIGSTGMIGITTPTQTYGSDTDWSAIAAGCYYTVALKNNSTGWGWGDNSVGQLGISDTSSQKITTPSSIDSNTDWSRIAAGGGTLYRDVLSNQNFRGYTIEMKTNGIIWACGQNTVGQLGLGSASIPVRKPAKVGTASDWSMVTAGYAHTIALKSNNTIWAWGDNRYGQLGFGDTISRTVPSIFNNAPNPPTTLVTTVISSARIDLSWSDNSDNEEGFIVERRTISSTFNTIAMVGQSIASYPDSDVTAGTVYYYRVKAYSPGGGSVYSNEEPSYPDTPSAFVLTKVSSSRIDLSWADNSLDEDVFKIERKVTKSGTYVEIATTGRDVNSYSDTGTFTPGITYYYRIRSYNLFGNSPYCAESLFGAWSAVAAGGNHNIGLKSDGTIRVWGLNNYGQLGLGIGDTTNRSTPTKVGLGTDWSVVAAGNEYTVTIKTNRTLWAWGRNDEGELGDASTTTRYTPRPIGIASDWLSVTTGSTHTIGMKTNKTLWAWGDNSFGQLGLENSGAGTNRTTPTPIGNDSDWSLVSGGDKYTISIKSTGSLWSWGLNNYGQLGLGDSMITRTTPTPIGNDSDWSAIVCGFGHSIALKTDGSLWTWGYNSSGQLGLGDNGVGTERTTPTKVDTASDWSAIAAGHYHSFAVKSNGTLWAWGDMSKGKLGFGAAVTAFIPTQVGTDTVWVTADGGANHSLGMKVNNNLWMWGDNTYRQLGLGSTQPSISIPMLLDNE